MKDKIRVLAVDDLRFARMYMDMYISTSSRYELAALLSYAEDVPEYIERDDVDLILLDIVMERGASGLSVAAQIKRTHPGIKIILCTSMARTDWMEQAKEIGVESFWYKEYSKLSLIEVMDRTVEGESIYVNDVPETYLGALPVSALTAKQKELLKYLINGYTNKVIAEKMLLSANTVKSYLDDIMLATGIHSRTELAVCASKLGAFSSQ